MNYIESENSYNKRKSEFNLIIIGLILFEIILIIITYLIFPTDKDFSKIHIGIIIFPTAIIFFCLILIKVIKSKLSVRKFKIKNEQFLNTNNKTDIWINFSRINYIKYSFNTENNHIHIFYDNTKHELYLNDFEKEDLINIINIFKRNKIKLERIQLK